ncbi:MAG: MmcQ/YjbR family DNA-binding protein [Ignavibacteria bacterium]|nr:MmcQ/YjbR family DNA-binding protein [Ignavibacteria bacterium]
MDVAILINHCLSKPYTYDDFPFDETTLVFKVFDKMFALFDLSSIPIKLNLKLKPHEVVSYVENYQFISPGYHMNKKHWITVSLVDTISETFVKELIDKSFIEVVKKLPKYKQKQIIEFMEDGNGKGVPC